LQDRIASGGGSLRRYCSGGYSLKNYVSVPVAPLEGKIVIDANNYYPERDGHIRELDREETTTSELLLVIFRNRKIVKALNAIEAPGIEQRGSFTEFVGTPRSSHRRR